MISLHIATVVVAAVLLMAAAGKLRARDGGPAEWSAMGIPAALNRPGLRRLHPIAEIALALGLFLPSPLTLMAAIGVLVLLCAYLAIVVRAARLPTPVPCACFGSRAPAPITGRTVVRNVLLVMLGAVAVGAAATAGSPFGGGSSVDGWVAMGLSLLALTTGWLMAPADAANASESLPASSVATFSTSPSPSGDTASFGQHDLVAIPPEPEDPEDYVRTPIPHAMVTTSDGTPTDLVYLSRLAPQLLIFASPGCLSCESIGAQLPTIRTRLPQVMVRIVSRLAADELRELQPAWADGSLHDLVGEASGLLQIGGTPSAVLLGADGLLAGGPVLGEPAVHEFIDDIEAALANP